MPPASALNSTAAPRPAPVSLNPGLVTLLIGTLLSLAGFLLHQRTIERDITLNFSRQVQGYLHALRDSARICRDTLESVRTLVTFHPTVSRSAFKGAAAESLRRYPALQAIEWSPSVLHAERASFEAAQRAGGLPDFHIYDRVGNTDTFAPAAPADHYLPILYTEPVIPNLPALGFNLYSGRGRLLMAHVIATHDIGLSMRLPLLTKDEKALGLLVYLPVYDLDANGTPDGPFRGIIAGALRLENFLTEVRTPADRGLSAADILLIDRSPDAEGSIIGFVHHDGRRFVENLPSAAEFTGPGVVIESFDLWTRQWELRFRPNPAWLAMQRGSLSWMLLALGLLTSGALGLVVHTRSRRTAFVENQVGERTAELRAAQAALAGSEERYRAFITQSAEPIWRCEFREPMPVTGDIQSQVDHFLAHAYIAECNDAMARACGHTDAAHIVGTPLSALLDPAVPQNRAFLRAFLTAPDYRLTDVETQEHDIVDHQKFFLNSIVGIVENGRLVRAWGTQRDITARRKAELALAESRRLLDSMMDQLPGMSVRCTANPGYPAIYISSGVELLTGYAARDFFCGLVRYSDLIRPEDIPLVWPAILAATAAHRSFQIQYRIRDRQSREHWVLEVGHGLYDPHDQLEFIDSLTIDITAQKIAESEKLTLVRKLAEGQKLESLGVLAGGIAHDFNNLLTAILGHASLARVSPRGTDTTESLGQIELAARRAADLCQQMLAYAGKSNFTTAPVDVSELVRGTVGLLEVSIGKNIRLALSLAPVLPPVLADATQLRQIIMNLVLNAADAIGSAPSGCIELITRRQHADHTLFAQAIGAPDLPAGDYTALEIRDNGCGMLPSLLARIFEPFFTTKFAGRGLGLSAVLGIVQGHHGALFVASTADQGTVFRLLLPSIAPVNVTTPAPTHGTMQPHILQGRSILVIDDEPTVRQITASVLKRFGLNVHAVGSGDEAVVLMRDQPVTIDLALLDLTMPGLSGEETLRILHELRPHLPVILMSGYSESDILSRLGQHGAVDFLQKPFELDVLRAKVALALSPPAG
jgi:signal transduction histidine kinase/CHASE1-domain containing sensor protein